MYYFAYGSNMNCEQMAYRCPGAVKIDNGMLMNYALIERQFADIEFKDGSWVNGVLWEITEIDLHSLDRYEGYPKFYTRHLADIIFDGRKAGAVVYEMTPAARELRNGKPYSPEYRKICSDGAEMNGIENEFKIRRETMSNHSDFIILAGCGHPYGGEGLIINDILSQHEKGGWYLEKGERILYWANERMEDALLMFSLYCDASYFTGLRRRAENLFAVSLFEHGIDTDNDRHITKPALQELYDENKRLLQASSVKIVGVQLGTSCGTGFDAVHLKNEFLNTVKTYDLKNYEYCETICGRYWGSFSKMPREFTRNMGCLRA